MKTYSRPGDSLLQDFSRRSLPCFAEIGWKNSGNKVAMKEEHLRKDFQFLNDRNSARGQEIKNPTSQFRLHTLTPASHPGTMISLGWGMLCAPQEGLDLLTVCKTEQPTSSWPGPNMRYLGPWMYPQLTLHCLYKGQRCTSTNIRSSFNLQ